MKKDNQSDGYDSLMDEYNYLDLFHGIGGFALGAYWAGMKFENHYCSDIELYCQKLYQLRFPDSIQLGDISKIDFEQLPKGEWIITGGFPCQDISIAGKGAGIEGERSGLWFEMWRAIRVLRPRFVIAENVGAITFRGLDRVLSSLAEIGYDAEWQDIRAEDLGAPHKRERIWIIAYPNIKVESKSTKYAKITGELVPPTRCCDKISDTISKYDDNSGYGASEIFRERSKQTEIQRSFSNSTIKGLERKEPERIRRGKSGLFAECDWWSVEPAICSLVDGLPPGLDRYEGRLSTNSYKKTDQLKGLGNSIVPQIAELLFRRIKEN